MRAFANTLCAAEQFGECEIPNPHSGILITTNIEKKTIHYYTMTLLARIIPKTVLSLNKQTNKQTGQSMREVN